MMRLSGIAWRGSQGEGCEAGGWYSLYELSYLRDAGLKQQALYCYRKVHSLDPANVDALWDRASLAVEIGDLKTVRASSFL